jgi:RimJ/RimL family protein N-acetyltransferase
MATNVKDVRVRALQLDEIDRFCELGEDSGTFKETLSELWTRKECCPEWCFVAEEDDRWIGRVAYWIFTSDPHELYMMGLELPWDGNYLRIGQELFAQSLVHMRERGAETLECRMYSGFTRFIDEHMEFFKRIRLPLIQEKWRFLWDREHKMPVRSERLWYRPLDDVGEDYFIEVVQRVMQGSLDRDDQAMVQAKGPEGAARHLFDILKELDDRPEWWRLSYDADDTVVGLIVPQRFSESEGAINYIGVVPEQRGRGYVNDLLAEGTLTLHEDGVPSVIADVDDVNSPMANALIRAGYEKSRTVWCYKTEIEKLKLGD